MAVLEFSDLGCRVKPTTKAQLLSSSSRSNISNLALNLA